jgi:hypothetical protein
VPSHPLAQRGGQPSVPADEQLVERGAVLATRPADEQHGDGRLKLVERPGEQRVGVVAGDPEHRCDLAYLEAMPELVDDVTFAGVQAAGRRPDERACLGSLGLFADVRTVVGAVRGGGERRRRLPGLQPVQALVAGDREQPGAQPLGIPQCGQLRRRDDESVLDRIGRVGWLVEQGLAIAEQGTGVPVIRRSQPEWVARRDGCDHLAVAHALNVVA